MSNYFPQRIVCMTEESVEMLYLLGEQDRIVGVSQFVERPAIAMDKPKVSAFTTADTKKIIDLKPDLVIGFSDIQANIASELIKLGLNVLIFNQRSIEEIYVMIQTLGAIVGKHDAAALWIEKNKIKLALLSKTNDSLIMKPKVYFEEWYDPIITSIRWVGEIITLAGGEECFPELSQESLAKNRIISDAKEILDQDPDIILVSWCGAKYKPEKINSREGWQEIKAIKNRQIFEIKSSEILQPGPAALTDGLQNIKKIINNWQSQYGQ